LGVKATAVGAEGSKIMKKNVDIHSHILAGLDDGAQSQEDMLAMLAQAHEDGTVALCLTPHYEPESFDYSMAEMQRRFLELQAYATEHFEGLTLYLGNEMSFRDDCVDRLRGGDCATIASGRYVLVDFFGASEVRQMRSVFDRLWCAGYSPIVAHVERYPFLWKKFHDVLAMSHDGVLLQVNASSLMTEDKSSPAKKMAEKLLSRGAVDVIASDAHDTEARLPRLSACRAYIEERYGEAYAEMLFYTNPKNILENKHIQV